MLPHARLLSSVRVFGLVGVASASLLAAVPARADIPAGYAGKPFDPAVAGGVGIIPTTVQAGPYKIPGRIDFVNYDLGGELVAFHAGDHITTKSGAGYRKDGTVATFSKTSQASKDVWYDTSATLDGMPYPTATTADFYIGAVQVNDWFNFTVDVQTAGTYMLSTTWSSGNGPPGGEGGDGAMGLQVYTNGAKLADWKSSFPDFADKASFHFWKAYPNFAMVTLPAGLQVIKLECTSKHLNLDYVQFDLMGADGGTTPDPDAGSSSSSGAAGTTGAAGTGSSSGAAGTGSSSGAAGTSSSSGAAGDGTAGTTSTSTGAAGTTSAGAAGTASSTGAAGTTSSGHAGASSGGCAIATASSKSRASLATGTMMLVVGLLARARRRRRAR